MLVPLRAPGVWMNMSNLQPGEMLTRAVAAEAAIRSHQALEKKWRVSEEQQILLCGSAEEKKEKGLRKAKRSKSIKCGLGLATICTGPAADHVELLIICSFQTSCVASLEPGSGTTWTWIPLVSLEFNQEGQLTGSNITAGGE